MDSLKRLLEYCENRIDTQSITNKIENQKRCLRFQEVSAPSVRVQYANPEFKPYSMEEIHQDVAKMMYNELAGCLPQIETNDGGIPMIRANYGVGILPSVFGVHCHIFNGNMPWCDHVGKEGVKAILSKGIPNMTSGFGQKVMDTYAFYTEMLSHYPKCKQAIQFYHPDYQGPFDVAHLLFGSDIYMEMYDDPDFIHELMELVCQTYIISMRNIKQYFNDETEEFVYHWHHLFPGKIVLRDDSAVNLSAPMYEEFVKPYNDKVLQAFGSGSMHFCGRADHWVFDMLADENIKAYNVGYMSNLVFGQEYLDFIHKGAFSQNKPVVAYMLARPEIETFDFRKYKSGITYNVWTSGKEDADELLKIIKNKSI